MGTGGEAKRLIQEGDVYVDGQPELRRGAKIRPGSRVDVQGADPVALLVLAESDEGEAPGA